MRGESAQVPAAVSVVMPVYNPGKYLLPALRSLEEQDLSAERFEVVAVDDGSTDGSGELLDRWAAEHRNVRVLHQPNSGWPGQPRNRGLEASTGEYVFFMDADDYLGPEALRRMVGLARGWDSDILVPSTVGVGGRRISGGAVLQTTPDADLTTVFGEYPQKLFRRAFLLEHGLRFPEGKVRLEDGIFLTRAYLSAKRVSSAADYDYYYLRRRADGGNISRRHLDPPGYIDSVRAIARIVRELCPDASLADALVLSVYRRKALKAFTPDRFLAYPLQTQRAWVEAVQALAAELVPVALEAQLPEPLRTRSALARAGDVAGQEAFARMHSDSGPPAPTPVGRRLLNRLGLEGRRVPDSDRGARLQVELRELVRSEGGLSARGRARLRGAPPAHLRLVLVLEPRGERRAARRELSLRTSRLDDEGWQWWHGRVQPAQVAGLPTGTWPVSLRTRRGELRGRVGLPDGLQLPEPLDLPRRRSLTAVATRRGQLALKVAKRPRSERATATPPGGHPELADADRP